MSLPFDWTRGLPASTEDPVLCGECGSLFGAGAEADTVCPYCAGSLFPIPAARDLLGLSGANHSDDGERR